MNKQTLIHSLLHGLALSATLISPAMAIYVYNPVYFTFNIFEFSTACMLLGGLLAGALTALLYGLRNWKHIGALQLGVLAVILLAWLQGTYLSSGLPNSPVDVDFMDNLTYLGAVAFLLFALVIAVMIIFRRFFLKHAHLILSLVFICNAAATCVMAYRQIAVFKRWVCGRYTFEEKNKFTFGSQENILLMVVDCLGEELFKEEIVRYPELKALFKDFVVLDKMTSTIPRTMGALPAMMTGVEFKHGMEGLGTPLHTDYLCESFGEKDTLLNRVKRRGYRCEGYPFMPNLVLPSPLCFDNIIRRLKHTSSNRVFLDVWLRRMTPYFLQRLLHFKWDIRTMFVTETDTGRFLNHKMKYDQAINNRLLREFSVGDHKNVFKYLHLQGSHVDLATDEHLEECHDTDKYRQLRGSLIIVENLLRLLKEHNLYETATIVITGDHSEYYTPEVVTLVKPPYQANPEMQWDSTPHTLMEIPALIEDLLTENEPQQPHVYAAQ